MANANKLVILTTVGGKITTRPFTIGPVMKDGKPVYGPLVYREMSIREVAKSLGKSDNAARRYRTENPHLCLASINPPAVSAAA